MMPKYDRYQLEQFIAQETTILQACVDLLNLRTPLADWPHDAQAAFLLAIQSGEGQEAHKAFNIARHLHLDPGFFKADIPQNPTSFQRRCSERIRADLSRLVRLGAGRYLHQ